MIAGTYNAGLVALSVLIAIVASYAAFDLGERVSASGGQRRWAWLTSGAIGMGFAIWSMHYVGMLAFVLPVPVLYHVPTVILSLVAAVAGAAIALYIVSKKTMRRVDTAIAGVCLGGAIVSMHYVGMAAMRSAAMHHYRLGLVLLSVVVAVTFSSLAAWLAFKFGRSHQGFTWTKISAASLMGVGIASMHYTAMAAAYFMLGYAPPMRHTVEVSTLGAFGIGMVTLLLLGTVLVSLWFDRWLANERLLQHLYGDLQEREAKIRRLVDANIIGVVISELEGQILEANDAFLKMLGYSREDLVLGRLRWTELTPAEWQDATRRAVAQITATGACEVFEKEYFRKDGRRVPVLIGAAGFKGNVSVAFVVDLTERKRVEEELRQREEALKTTQLEIQALNERLISSQEEERARIARELHDDLSQQLAALSLKVAGLQRRLVTRAPECSDETAALRQRIVEISERVRLLSHELHPGLLEHVGLSQALRSHCEQFSSLTGVPVGFVGAALSPEPPVAVGLCLLRIAQEALKNVGKHARANRVEVGLMRNEDAIVLTICDDGTGFDPNRLSGAQGLGLLSMKERARLVKGAFRVESTSGLGTKITAEVPIVPPAAG